MTADMTADRTPITGVALFFDDIRIEIGAKLTLIGQYIGTLFHNESAIPIERLAVLLYLRWPRDYIPENCSIRVEITGQPPVTQEWL
jgi:hypothetical protein